MDISVLLMSVGPPPAAARPAYMASADDARIIRASLDGDERATEELIRRYWDEAARSALLIIGDESLAEDVAQEAFIAVLGSLKKFDPSRPFGAWLHRIAVNKAIDTARKARRQPEPTDLEQQDDDALAAAPPMGDLGAQVLEALTELDADDRAMLVARYVLDYRAVEIAEWFEMPASTVRVRIHRAAARVRELVGEGEDDGSND